VGSIPTSSTKSFLSCSSEVLRFAQDFACGLRGPQTGSSSIPTSSTKFLLVRPNDPADVPRRRHTSFGRATRRFDTHRLRHHIYIFQAKPGVEEDDLVLGR